MEYKFPVDLKYTATHEWVRIEDEEAIVGITDYAQYQLGDIVFVELPNIGMVFEKGSNAGEIESVKAVGDFIMPLSGEVMETNAKLADAPELINADPYGKGWMIKIKINHDDEFKDLLSVEQYKELVEKEDH